MTLPRSKGARTGRGEWPRPGGLQTFSVVALDRNRSATCFEAQAPASPGGGQRRHCNSVELAAPAHPATPPAGPALMSCSSIAPLPRLHLIVLPCAAFVMVVCG